MTPSVLAPLETDATLCGIGDPPTPGTEGCSRCLSDDDVAALLEPALTHRHGTQLERHLATCPDCRDLVRAACMGLDDDAPPSAIRGAFCTLFEPGMVVARRYCIKRLLGRGGMGEVYEAFDLLARRSVALKTLRASLCDDRRARARLRSEFRVVRSIQHPNVCRMLDLDSHASDGAPDASIPFFTMDHVPGDTLRRRLTELGPLEGPVALEVGSSILHGLAAIHAAHVVHRDLKSDNVLVHEHDGRLRVVLIDFGLARHTRGVASALGAEPTGPSGSLGYMAPEQVLGERQTPAADVFSFGVILFEMLTARLPFGNLERGHINMANRRIEPHILSSVLERARPELGDFLARCLEPRPEQRFADGAAALRALAAVCARKAPDGARQR